MPKKKAVDVACHDRLPAASYANKGEREADCERRQLLGSIGAEPPIRERCVDAPKYGVTIRVKAIGRVPRRVGAKRDDVRHVRQHRLQTKDVRLERYRVRSVTLDIAEKKARRRVEKW